MVSLYLDNLIMGSLFRFFLQQYGNTVNAMPIAYLVISN